MEKSPFALDKNDAPSFHRALQNAKREVNLIHTMQDLGLPMEQMTALSPTVHRLAADNFQLDLTNFFDNRYDDEQFGEMLSLVNAYLDQAISERYGEHSKLNDMLEAKSNFDRSIKLSDFFSQHDFSDEQKNAISAMFVGDVTRGQIESIDETFTVQDIHDYDEILHTALQESEISDFLTAHRQAVNDFIKNNIPDISDDTVKQLITAFDNAAMHGWEKGDNLPKINRIKRALYDVLGDEEQTEKAFACIAKYKYNVTFEPEKKPDSLEFQFGYSNDGNDQWFTESDLLSDFAEEHGEISFALANALMEYLDDKQHKERMIPNLNAGYYKKTNFEIRAVVDGEEFTFSNRFDIGDGKGTGGGSLIDHIRTICENAVTSTAYPYNTPESKETPQNMLNILVPYLEANSGLTAEEQKILDDFKEKNPIRSIDDVEKAQGTFKIYQLPGGEKYHGIRFEGMEQLKKDGVQLNKDDYELVYENMVGEFRGNATLEGIFTQFNTNQPADFTGHSLSVSDVIVISVNDKDTAYYCDSFGFTEMPEFFRDKELVEEKTKLQKFPISNRKQMRCLIISADIPLKKLNR